MRRFTPALARGLGLAALACVVGEAAGCGRETFDLLPSAGAAGSFAGTSSIGSGGTAAAVPSAGASLGGSSAADAGIGAGAGAGGQENAGAGGRRFPQAGAGGNSPCLNGAMCMGSGGGGCSVSTPFCTPCQTSKDCPSEAANCDKSGRCYECRRNDECSAGRACNTLAMVCATTCKEDNDCNGDPGHRVCNTDFDVCVSCMDKSQCSLYNNGGNNTCYFSSCVECFDNRQCGSQDCVAGRCQNAR